MDAGEPAQAQRRETVEDMTIEEMWGEIRGLAHFAGRRLDIPFNEALKAQERAHISALELARDIRRRDRQQGDAAIEYCWNMRRNAWK